MIDKDYMKEEDSNQILILEISSRQINVIFIHCCLNERKKIDNLVWNDPHQVLIEGQIHNKCIMLN